MAGVSPMFRLTTQDGKSVELKDLAGGPWCRTAPGPGGADVAHPPVRPPGPAGSSRAPTGHQPSYAQGDARLAQQSLTPGLRRREHTRHRGVKPQFRMPMC